MKLHDVLGLAPGEPAVELGALAFTERDAELGSIILDCRSPDTEELSQDAGFYFRLIPLEGPLLFASWHA